MKIDTRLYFEAFIAPVSFPSARCIGWTQTLNLKMKRQLFYHFAAGSGKKVALLTKVVFARKCKDKV